MTAGVARTLVVLAWGLMGLGVGCTSSSKLLQGPIPAGIHRPLLPPVLPPLPDLPSQLPPRPERPETSSKEGVPDGEKEAPAPAEEILPYPRMLDSVGVLELAEVLDSVERAFPLLLAAEQERAVASGKRLSAEGGFDLNLRTRGIHQDGTFPSDRLDFVAEQPTPCYGTSFFSGYRFGFGDFPGLLWRSPDGRWR